MIPIDGEKLIRELDAVIKNGENPQRSDAFKSVIFAIQNGNYNLPPGTLVIPREEKTNDISCQYCIIVEYMCKNWGCLEMCNKHTIEEEWIAAYIVGGGDHDR